jgi:hypothetical protein
MDDDLEAIVSIPEEIEGECTSSLVREECGFAEGEDILPFNFDIALSVVEGNEDPMEEEIDDAISEISGEKSFPCNSCEKICKSKGGLTRHINAKHKNKNAHGAGGAATPVALYQEGQGGQRCPFNLKDCLDIIANCQKL